MSLEEEEEVLLGNDQSYERELAREPNKFDTAEYEKAARDLSRAIEKIWEAGATFENLEHELGSILDNLIDDGFVHVEIEIV